MENNTLEKMRKDALEIFNYALESVDPVTVVKRYLKIEGETLIVQDMRYTLPCIKNIYLIGFGKAAAAMARGVEEVLGDKLKAGIVNVKYGHTDRVSSKITINEAGHPVPDEAGIQGTNKIIELVKNCEKEDLVICVISGGGSALFLSPEGDITLNDIQETTKRLLECGATIKEVNTIRKHISKVKGGKLAKIVYPAPLVVLILSDVVGDLLDVIASGPTAPDETTFDDCMAILKKYNVKDVPEEVINHLKVGVQKEIPDTPTKDDPVFNNKKIHNVIVGNNWQALTAANEKAAMLGYNTMILSSFIEGETKEVAKVHAAIAKEALKTGNPIQKPACIISGGETTVTIKGKGLGGRNQEFVLAAAMDIQGLKNVVVLSAGTDGTDGPTDAAGALGDGATIHRAHGFQMEAVDYLEDNDSYHFFEKLDDLIKTGPTNTNVMDLRLILVR
jgi:hydroxypyruvate reductase